MARIVELTPDAKHLKGFGAVSKNTKGIAFFDKFDCNEKTLIPFSTHGGSGWSGTIEDIKGLVPNATMVNGYSLSRNNTATSRNGILNWLQEINVTSKWLVLMYINQKKKLESDRRFNIYLYFCLVFKVA